MRSQILGHLVQSKPGLKAFERILDDQQGNFCRNAVDIPCSLRGLPWNDSGRFLSESARASFKELQGSFKGVWVDIRQVAS